MFRYQLLDYPEGSYQQAFIITTPACLSATEIDPSLPTLLFVPPKVSAGMYYDPQFQDARLRSRFNLVLLNGRASGASNERERAVVKDGYGVGDVASEFVDGMKQLGIKHAHLVGADLGAMVALRIAAEDPSVALSVSLLGPLSEVEHSEDMRQGMLDVLSLAENLETSVTTDCLAEAILASGDKKFGSVDTPYRLAAPLADIAFHAEAPCTPNVIKNIERAMIRVHIDRTSLADGLLAQISCPVLLVQAQYDLDYPAETSTIPLEERLRKAGKQVRTVTIDGAPHYLTVTHPLECNDLLYDFIASARPDDPALARPLLDLPPPHLSRNPPPASPLWTYLEPFVPPSGAGPTDRAGLLAAIAHATQRVLQPTARERRPVPAGVNALQIEFSREEVVECCDEGDEW